MPILAWTLAAAIGQKSTASEITHESWFPGSSSISEKEDVPPAYRGRWAPDAAECADQDGVERIEISARGVDYYESGGRLERITQAGQDRSVKVRLSYEGERTFWDSVETWTLSGNGKQLAIARADGREADRLVRCD